MQGALPLATPPRKQASLDPGKCFVFCSLASPSGTKNALSALRADWADFDSAAKQGIEVRKNPWGPGEACFLWQGSKGTGSPFRA